MNNISRSYFSFLGGLCLLFILSCEHRSPSLNIAVSANMQFAMEALVEEFENSSDIDCNIILGSSGKLTAQITEGAPYDIFFSADVKYPDHILSSDLATETPKVYAFGQLILWSTVLDSIPSDLNSLRQIAIPNPGTAPYGRAAIEYLKANKLYDLLEPKLVYGESVAQTNQIITSGAVDAGFTSLSVVSSDRINSSVHRILPQKSHQPIEQAYVQIQNKRGLESEVKSFVEFVSSTRGKEILTNFGYLIEKP